MKDDFVVTPPDESFLGSAFRTLFIERRMPYRVNEFVQNILYKRATDRAIDSVLDTPPIQLGENPCAEIRILSGDANVNMTILALKSFLRFCNDVAVVIHDDGSITEASRKRITRHIVGAEVVSLAQVDALIRQNPGVWKQRKEAFSYFRFMPITVHKLFDLYFLSSAEKMIVMDSDVLFLTKPNEVINWITGDLHYNLYARPRFRNLMIDDDVVAEKFPGLDVIKTFNSGLLCIRRDQVGLDMVLEVLERLKNDPRTPILGDECIWRFVFSMTESRELSFERYPLFSEVHQFREFLNDHPEVGYIHFLLKHRGGIYRKLTHNVVSELLA